MKILNRYTYTEIARMGDLRDYRLQQIPFYLKKMQMEEVSRGEFIMIRIWDSKTEYVLIYDLEGVFVLIESEVWIK